MHRALISAAIATAASAATMAAAPPGLHTWQIQGDDDTFGYNVSGNGQVVAADLHYAGPNGGQAHAWTLGGVVQPLGVLGFPGNSRVGGISFDGSIVVGSSKPQGGFDEAFRWSATTGMVGLGMLQPGQSSYATDISANGQVIVGSSGAMNTAQAFRHTQQGGMVGLGVPSGFQESGATAVSGDGSVIVGNAYTNIGIGRPFRWTQAGGYTMLPLDSGLSTWANDVSINGSVIVGEVGDRPYLWSSGGNQYLSTFNGTADATNADGSVVVGMSEGLGLLGGPPQAFIWDAVGGFRSLESFIEVEAGLDLNGFRITRVTDVSADGRTFVGWGDYMSGDTMAFAVVVPGPSALAACLGLSLLSVRRRRRK